MSIDNSDPEKTLNLKDGGGSIGESPIASPQRAEFEDGPKKAWPKRVLNSFKRDPNASVIKKSALSGGRFDHKTAAENTANSGLVQKLQSRHLQMIAIGGSIGALFSFSLPLANLDPAPPCLGKIDICCCTEVF
jgi:amino acid transporter